MVVVNQNSAKDAATSLTNSQQMTVLKVVPFTNVLDKGYRPRAANWEHGRQLTAQHTFKKSDRQFKGTETLFSADLATDRDANKRGENITKRCGIIERG